jgi:VWFA-related protein
MKNFRTASPILAAATSWAVALVLSSVPLAAQRPAAKPAAKPSAPSAPSGVTADTKPQEFFGETMDVTVVNVDVYVTDKSGNRVKGLTQDDFELFEDKKPVQITNFYSIEAGKPVRQLDPDGVEREPLAAGEPAPGIPDEQKLSLIVYVDNFNLRPFNRNRALKDLRQFLNEKVRPGDRVMLVSYDRELHVRRAFTTDPQVIASALFELEKISAQGTHADSERRDILEEIDDAEDVSQVYGRARSYAESLFNDLEFTIGALKSFVDQMAGLPGRKAILYVSDGVPMRAGEDIFHALSIKFPQKTSLLEAQSYDASRRFVELANQANANRVSFYTLEATGLRVSSAADASQRNPGLGVQVEQIHFSNLQSTLQMLAEKTGGVAILNANQLLPRLERVADDFETYYSLGYSPSHSGDGRYHKIEVKAKRKGLIVRHREGYRDKPVDSRMSDGILANLRFGGDANSMGVAVDVGDMTSRSDGLFSVQLTVRVPIGKILMVPRETVNEGRVRVYVAAMDKDGGTSEVANAPVAIQVPPAEAAEAAKKYYAYTLTLVMRRGEQRVSIGVRDDLAGTTAFVSKSLVVG